MAASFQYPESVPDWNNISVIHKNTLRPRATFYNYTSEKDALSRDVTKSKTLSLSGTWKFDVASYPHDPCPPFYKPDFDSSSYSDIEVPGMWQLQGFGAPPQYTNVDYPFPVNPPDIPHDDNETGYYLRSFEVPKNFADHQLRLRFEGVDSAFHVWVNGKEVGYSQGSRNPSEWDITSFVDVEKPNSLAVRVYKRCDGTYIEDQDQWWLSGIFRDVNLLAFPKTHIQDFKVETILKNDYVDAVLSVAVELSTSAKVDLKLFDGSLKLVKETSQSTMEEESSVHFRLPIKAPHLWTAEDPYLYHLVLSLEGGQVISQRIGFRQSEVKDGLIKVNGKPLMFRGVNRHEHHPKTGRTVPYEYLRNDLLIMKTHNINGIRTSHQPNDPRLYDLADELGFWVIDEADLECHGFTTIEDSALPEKYKSLSPSERQAVSYAKATRWTSDNPEWKVQYVDRAEQLVMRDKNHACVVLWSLGNEAFYGSNHQAMYDWIKSYDTTRPVHYEGDWEAKTVDVYSRMYPSVDELIDFATKDETWDKPMILCEFVHAMGNGPGAIKEYMDAFYKYKRLQGGFVWEWANHGLLTRNAAGEEYYAYGGDFGDVPNDGNFVMDGLLFSDHTPTPGLIEWKKAIEPVQVLEDSTHSKVKIINRYDFLTLDHLKCEWTIVGDGFERSSTEVAIPAGIKPGETAEINIKDVNLAELSAESYLQVSFSLKESTNWAKAGHEIAWGQVAIKSGPTIAALKLAHPSENITVTKAPGNILEIVGSENHKWKFDLTTGTLISWIKNGTALLASPPTLSLYRARTDNDIPIDGVHWQSKRLHQATTHASGVTATQDEKTNSYIIKVQARTAPPVYEWAVSTTTTYTFTSSSLSIHVHGSPSGINLPDTFARIGLTFKVPRAAGLESAEWFGRGPGESYKDKKLSQRFGNWTVPIAELDTVYEFPQETGNRTDVRWVAFGASAGGESKSAPRTSGKGLKVSFGEQQGCSFGAGFFGVEAYDEAKHPYELEKSREEDVVVRLDWDHHGLGTGACGPAVLEKYHLKPVEFDYEVLLE